MTKIIGQFNDSYTPIADGVTNVVRNYAYWLGRKDCECYVVTPRFPGYRDEDGFEVLRYISIPVPKRPPYRAGLATLDPGVKNRLKNIDFDLIHAHSPFSAGRLGLKIARNLNIPVITTFHSKYLDDFKDVLKSDMAARLMLKIIMGFYKEVDEVWTVSNCAAETLREYGYKGKVEVVGNGVDLICGTDGEYYKREGNGTLRLLYVGQLIWHKNLRLLISALKILKNKGFLFKMTMVGEGNAQQGIKKLVQRFRMEEDFDFTGRINDREKVRSIYSQTDIFLFPSVYDTFSMVVREAAAMRCPSIVIKGSCAAEDIIDGYNGYFSENNEEAYAESIVKAASDRTKLRAAGTNAQNSIYKSWESVLEGVAERYDNIIGRYRH